MSGRNTTVEAVTNIVEVGDRKEQRTENKLAPDGGRQARHGCRIASDPKY